MALFYFVIDIMSLSGLEMNENDGSANWAIF